MSKPAQLTLEQQFSLRSFEAQVKQLTPTETKKPVCGALRTIPNQRCPLPGTPQRGNGCWV